MKALTLSSSEAMENIFMTPVNTQRRVPARHLHAAAVALLLFCWQISFAVMKSSRWTERRVQSPVL